MAGKGKVVKSGTMTPVRGGKGHMFGKQHAGPQKPGGSAHNVKGSGGKFAKGGGTGKVGGRTFSQKAKGGTVTVTGGR